MGNYKVLNLYAGAGGNRKLWENVDVTSIEKNAKVAKLYSSFFPDDRVIITDAHAYLLDHYAEYDFIWSSPPCPSHSRTNIFLNAQGIIRYPDMRLYQEILFLQKWFRGKYCVENVIPYYKPLIKAQLIDRHLFWCNFVIGNTRIYHTFNVINGRKTTRRPSKDHLIELQEYIGLKIDDLTILRNCVNPQIARYIFDCAFKEYQVKLNGA